jgi:hypothetical protein
MFAVTGITGQVGGAAARTLLRTIKELQSESGHDDPTLLMMSRGRESPNSFSIALRFRLRLMHDAPTRCLLMAHSGHAGQRLTRQLSGLKQPRL